ncbi:MAG: signal peptidase II [Anaerolineales bacterium]
MKRIILDYWLLLILAGSIVGIDQWTKSLVRSNLALGEMYVPWQWLEPYARIVHWKNTGAAFGIFQGFGDVFTVLAIFVALLIIYYYPKISSEDWTLRLALGLQLGGALGNLIDRLTIGWVIDFISVGNFPVFNVADSSITIGVVVLILGIWAKERHEKASRAQQDNGAVSSRTSEKITEES